jgi:hypothetical protein
MSSGSAQALDSMGRIHGFIHIPVRLGSSQDLDSMHRTHGFIHTRVGLGRSQGLDSMNRIHCFIHIRGGCRCPLGMDSMNRIHGIIHIIFGRGCPQCLGHMNPIHGFIHRILGLGCSQGLGHATQSPLLIQKKLILHIIRARCAELGFSFGKGIFTQIRYSFPLFKFKNAKKRVYFMKTKFPPRAGVFVFSVFIFLESKARAIIFQAPVKTSRQHGSNQDQSKSNAFLVA